MKPKHVIAFEIQGFFLLVPLYENGKSLPFKYLLIKVKIRKF